MAGIAIFGGTFNPPHLGHLAVARQARDELGLEVWLMPVAMPSHKAGIGDPGPQARLAMCRLLVADEPGIEVSSLEAERGGPSYTADTLESIHASHPEAELTFVVGADIAATLPEWNRPEAILRLAGLAVAAREGTDRERVLAAVASIPGAPAEVSGQVRFLHMPPIEVSSSQAREQAARGGDLSGLLGPAVAAYVRERGLYREGGR